MVSKRKRLWQAIHEVLLTQWNPFCIYDIPVCEDEYDSYIPGIIRLLTSGADEYKMTNHLRGLELHSIGFSESNSEKNKQVAQLLLQLVN